MCSARRGVRRGNVFARCVCSWELRRRVSLCAVVLFVGWRLTDAAEADLIAGRRLEASDGIRRRW
jgi:hypothetical protein